MPTKKRISCAALISIACFATTALGQEGFPLDGTWRGEWGPVDGGSNHVVFVMKWDGESINGRINPGPNSIDFTNATLEPSTWTVRIRATNSDGEIIEIEGVLQNIGSYNRYVEGSWTQAGTSHPFRITRE